MNLLQLTGLTVRFGGLTAVSDVDLHVEAGEVVSLIGPNGAGKTTLFNAVTGLCDPTEGTIRVTGRLASRTWTWKVATACVVAGVLTALLAALVGLNPDLLWRAAIKRTMADPQRPFSCAGAARAAWAYVRGDLALERTRSGRWTVTTADGKQTLGSAANESEARRLRDELEAMLTQPGVSSTAEIGSVRHDLLAQVARDRRAAHVRVIVALLLGLLLGAFGTYAAWRRTRRTPDVIARAGVARTFQNIRLFRGMTALENVRIGTDRALTSGAAALRARELLAFVGLAHQADRPAGDLAYGDQRRLEIARALATGPRLLLLDEPAAGMNPAETAALTTLIRRIRDTGVTVLLIEHHMSLVMRISDRIVVLDHGVKIAEGTPAEIREHPAVIEAYLGKEEVA